MIGNKERILSELSDVYDERLFELKEYKETRTLAQNRLYHDWIECLVGCFSEKGIFITHDDLHSGLRDKLIKGNYETNPVTGKRQVKRKSTTELNKTEFSKYLKDIEQYLWQTFEISCSMLTDDFNY